MRKKSLIDVYILEILERHASSRKRITQEDIIGYLDQEYGLFVTRKTLSGYLKELREEGYIRGQRGIYRVNKFDDTELRLLIDGVLFGHHVPEEDASVLIEKLKDFSYDSMKNRVKHVCYLPGMHHTDNTRLYEMIDTIDEAIEKERKIEITGCYYGTDGRLYDWGTSVVDPYYLVTEKSMYYLICYAGREDLDNRRIDRISAVKILEEPRKPLRSLPKYASGFNLATYMREHIYMFSGESKGVYLRLKKRNMGDFIDWFGKEYYLVKEEGELVTVRIVVNENAMYYWALQYGAVAEVLKPQELRERVKEGLKDMLRKYED